MTLMATTVDNPHDPFTDFKQWFLFDFQRYNTLGRIAKLVPNCQGLSDSFQADAWDEAVEEFASYMPTLYKVVEGDEYPLPLEA